MIPSMIASATVWSAMASYHALTGICDAMMVISSHVCLYYIHEQISCRSI